MPYPDSDGPARLFVKDKRKGTHRAKAPTAALDKIESPSALVAVEVPSTPVSDGILDRPDLLCGRRA